MHRSKLMQLLSAYPKRKEENGIKERFIQFVGTQLDCFERSLEIGHVTASAWIIDRKVQQVLLAHHKKPGLV